MLENLAQVLHFRRHQQPGGCLLDVMDDPLGRGVRAMRRTECVVHVRRPRATRAPSRIRCRSFLLPAWNRRFSSSTTLPPFDARSMAARAVSPMQSSANSTGRPRSSDSRAATGLSEYLGIGLAFRSPEMRRQDDRGALVERVLDRRQRRADARVVGNRAVLDRHVEVHADEDALAGEIEIRDAPRQLRAPS